MADISFITDAITIYQKKTDIKNADMIRYR